MGSPGLDAPCATISVVDVGCTRSKKGSTSSSCDVGERASVLIFGGGADAEVVEKVVVLSFLALFELQKQHNYVSRIPKLKKIEQLMRTLTVQQPATAPKVPSMVPRHTVNRSLDHRLFLSPCVLVDERVRK